MSHESEMDSNISCIPLELEEAETSEMMNIVPEKSKRQYEKTYTVFGEWCKKKYVKKVSEDILLTYLMEKSKTVKSSTLWSVYSMLKCMLNIKEGIDVRKFSKLIPFLKKKSVGYQAKKSNVFTREQINLFLIAGDEDYLLWKVILIMGISGALRRNELTNMTIDDIQDVGPALIVRVPHTNIGMERNFVISNSEFIQIYRKYAALRPAKATSRRFFLRYENGKCTTQVVGIHKIGEIPCLIAKYLGLPDSEGYTGHCYRKSSATLLANSGAGVVFNHHDDWRLSKTKEGYVEDSIENKLNILHRILICELLTSKTGV